MKKMHGIKLLAVILMCCTLLLGCGQTQEPEEEVSVPNFELTEVIQDEREAVVDALSKVDMSKWQYHSGDNVYWQAGIPYCRTPLDETHENMAFYVPGEYFDATDNRDGTYTCTMNQVGTVGGYTAATAPIVVPVNTMGYMAMKAPSGYEDFGYGSIRDYTQAGFVLAVPGARGRESGAPAGVTDFKAAIRYIRYNAGLIPGNTEAIFTEGMSGGGAQSVLIGVSGNNTLYDPYLNAIGALQGYSDAVMGSMAWCPITNLDEADAAYEWNLGSSRNGLTEEKRKISDALAASYADYINRIGLLDENGRVLTLESSETGIAQAGSYYDRVLQEIELSLNHFLEDTSFPYTPPAVRRFGMRGGPGNSDGNGQGDDISRNQKVTGIILSGPYETVADYIAALNENHMWVKYDADTNTASVTSVSDFVNALKKADKNLGAFDQLDAKQGENILFDTGGSGAHFDFTLGAILAELDAGEAHKYAQDFEKQDFVGNTVAVRVNMYTPLYYLLESQEGYKTSDVAPFWRIRTGINQGDTALCTELNLALALGNYEAVKNLDFAMVWGQGHTEAERKGGHIENFIAWVNLCMQEK